LFFDPLGLPAPSFRPPIFCCIILAPYEYINDII
jgi:hypothetical protein